MNQKVTTIKRPNRPSNPETNKESTEAKKDNIMGPTKNVIRKFIPKKSTLDLVNKPKLKKRKSALAMNSSRK